MSVREGVIIACSSAPGRSARALVRLSGASLDGLARAHVAGAPAGRGCATARLVLPGLRLPVLAVRFPPGASYTGEDVLEIVMAGNPRLVERAVGAFVAAGGAWGVRRAEAGEFTARAYLAGRLTLEKSEGVAATIAAQNEAQLSAARSLLSGRMGEVYRGLADRASKLLALVEAGVDFTDQEDVVAIAPEEARREIERLIGSLDELLVGLRGGEQRETRAVVVLLGRSNAGKSTLFNALLGRRRSVESPIAGTTRDAIGETLDLSRARPGSGEVTLVDLPGLEGESEGGAAEAAQGAARRALARADAVVFCDPEGVFDEPAPVAVPVIRVRTFADRARRGGVAGVEAGVIEVCALDGHGLDDLRRRIAELAVASGESGVAGLVPRHRAALARARRSLSEGVGVVGEPELLAEALRGAVSALGEIVGRIDPDEILGRVFAQFCIGK